MRYNHDLAQVKCFILGLLTLKASLSRCDKTRLFPREAQIAAMLYNGTEAP